MANYIVVNYFFKVMRRHWLSFHHYLDPLDCWSKVSSNTRVDDNNKNSTEKTTQQINKKINKKKRSSVVPSNNSIITTTTTKISKWDLTFFYPILHMTFCSLYGNVYLVYAAKKEKWSVFKNEEPEFKFEWNLNTILLSPYMLFHQVFPRLMWPQSDVCDTIGIVGAIAIYCSFLRNPVPHCVKYSFVEAKANTVLAIGQSGKTQNAFDF